MGCIQGSTSGVIIRSGSLQLQVRLAAYHMIWNYRVDAYVNSLLATYNPHQFCENVIRQSCVDWGGHLLDP